MQRRLYRIKRTEPLDGERVDISKAVDNAKAQKMQIGNDMSKIIMTDRFETSGEIVFAELPPEDKKAQSDHFEYAGDIDFNDRYTQMVIYTKSLMATCNGGSVPTKESIAEYYGNMATRLDAAYAEGKFTKEEYDYLNEGIAERMEHSADCAEETAAFFEVGHDRSMSQKAYREYMSMPHEERQADMQSKINDYIDKYFKIDRTSLLKMFNAVRYGK